LLLIPFALSVGNLQAVTIAVATVVGYPVIMIGLVLVVELTCPLITKPEFGRGLCYSSGFGQGDGSGSGAVYNRADHSQATGN